MDSRLNYAKGIKYRHTIIIYIFFTNIRNDMLKKEREKMGHRLPDCKSVKTGTTIAGIVYKDGVVLGADTRATAVR